MANVHFVTGYPGFIGKRLVAGLLEKDRRGQVHLLVQPKFARDARRMVREMAPKDAARVHVLVGDIVDMHLGLSGEEYRRLTEEVTHVFHLAAISYLGVDRRTLERVNVEGTRNVLELARDARHLVRMSHVSTVHVAGDRQGVIDEDELEEGQRFHNAYEETKFKAEVLVRKAMAELPITVFRPSTVVGDSRTGEIDRFDGPYYTAFQLVTSPLRVPLPLPGDGSFPLNVVPSDFVVSAILELTFAEAARGKTFHLVDPNPMSARKVYEYVARKAGKRTPRVGLPLRASAAILRLPFVEKLARPQRAAIEHLGELVIYNCRNTLELLDGTGIRCPPLTSYLDKLLAFVEEHQRQRREARVLPEHHAEDQLAEEAQKAVEPEPTEVEGAAEAPAAPAVAQRKPRNGGGKGGAKGSGAKRSAKARPQAEGAGAPAEAEVPPAVEPEPPAGIEGVGVIEEAEPVDPQRAAVEPEPAPGPAEDGGERAPRTGSTTR